ncbi:chemotaxis protein CheW [Geothrix oryzae]|jgi:purine-binding chemotaxis protein CheW|uniref:Chemotaxis protein CheW n=1 Tax=Geothrix oryzae TaxID=2927975 RepID=A0ABM8DS16_9BACT|nr:MULTISPECIES: chemotaxis protein CheW [Geothrix]BDU69829.1 chemotaxis protein CheW [Geothrix oryzae]
MAAADSSFQALQQVLCFALAGEAYALPILKVREIQAQATITRIPKAPSYMPGVINLRGAIVPILELRQRFALGEAPEDTRPVIIIVEVQGRTLGIRVDSVSDVLDLDASAIRPAPELGTQTALGREFIAGLASLPGATGSDSMLILLDLDRLLSDGELLALEAATA